MDYNKQFEKWLSFCTGDKERQELESLSEREKEDRFYRNLEFGTGGLRGVMALGTNRMNIYTVRRATQGLAMETLSNGNTAAERGVVIAHDSRNNSRLFAMECARVMSANGIKTYLFEDLRPTPELSFAVRYLGCERGIVITASHNPKEYNGYKVYGADGGQISPSTAENIIKYINEVDMFEGVRLSDNINAEIIGEEVDREYIKAVKNQAVGIKIPHDFKLVYTPLHGAGSIPVQRILKEIGVNNVFTVPEQEKPDGSFPTVQSPNPENREAFDIALEYAREQKADIVIGTDPDSDRMGIAVRTASGDYEVLNGNQTGCLLCEFILRKSAEKGEVLRNASVIKTIVTTEMVRAIADEYSVQTIDVLTGFKFIGDKIKDFETAGQKERFVFGLEESYGYLKGTYCRDKDAVVAAMLICEAAADYKANGKTLYEGLTGLYEKYGYYMSHLETLTLKGIEGAEKIKQLMEYFRNSTLPMDITQKIDYTEGIGDIPKSDVLKFITPNGWFAIRPSGTEPKIKFYFEVKAESEREAKALLTEFTEKVKSQI